MALTKTWYIPEARLIPGCPLLVDDPVAAVAVTSASAVQVFGGFPGTDLTVAPNNFGACRTLFLKLFFNTVVVSEPVWGTPFEFIVTVTGPFQTYTTHRMSNEDFATTHSIIGWDNSGIISATVSILPLPPATAVSLKVLGGLALDTMDLSAEGAV